MGYDYLAGSERFRKLLDKEEIRLREALKADQQDVAEIQSEWQERDSAAENNLRTVEWNQYISLQKALTEIDDAKRRLAEGIYGICAVCEEPIGLKRIKALPTARMCIECKQKEENLHGTSKGNPSL